MKLEFYGAADRVTGSCHILHVNGLRILLDCGLIQGGKGAQALNFEAFPFRADSIDVVILSHAHIDHSGRLPLLVRRGFKGAIHTQNASRDVASILLQDSARIQEEDAKNKNRWLKKRGKSAVKPLYTEADAKRCLARFKGHPYEQKVEVAKGVTVRFVDAGHIIGSASLEIWLSEGEIERKIVFSGDLGQYDKPILNDPAVIKKADLVLIESTYGNRLHRERRDTINELGEIIASAKAEGGNVLIPAFALGRSQEILYELGKHYVKWELSDWQIFLNSPMAIAASRVYWDYPHLYDDEASRLRKLADSMPKLDNIHFTESVADSKAINRHRGRAIILAGSGMMNGGRILHHLKHNVGRPECHLVIAGYQGRGTLGRLLVDGADTIKIHRKEYPVKINIHTIGGMSAHGDKNDLLQWLGNFQSKPHVCIIHGEAATRASFAKTIEKNLGFSTTLGEIGKKIDLTSL